MGYKKRIEKTVEALFNEQKRIDNILDKVPNEISEGFYNLSPDLCEIALNLLGMPDDNWDGIVSQEEYDEAVKNKVLVCRDSLYDSWRDSETIKEFLDYCNEFRLSYLEELKRFNKSKNNARSR